MYVDRKLAGLQAVQTLSRLNRTMHGKTKTYILDFQNTMEDIQDAFRPYFEATALEAMSDPNQVYVLEGRPQPGYPRSDAELVTWRVESAKQNNALLAVWWFRHGSSSG